MTAQSDTDRIDNVAPGDLISLNLPDTEGELEYKVVFTEAREDDSGTTMVVTLEGDDGETRDVELAADTIVTRTLESKWESPQSPTAHDS